MWHHGWVSLVISDYPAKFGDHMIINLLEEEILSFQFVMWLYVTTWSEGHVTHGWVTLIISHSPVKFGGHKPCGIGDIKLLICRLTSRDHVVRGSCGIMGEFPSSQTTTLPNFAAIGFAEQEILFYIGHVTSRVHMVNGLCGIMNRCLSYYVTTAHVLCQFFLKIHNLLVMTCVDLWPVFLTNRL